MPQLLQLQMASAGGKKVELTLLESNQRKIDLNGDVIEVSANYNERLSASDVGTMSFWNELPSIWLFASFVGRGPNNYNVFNVSSSYQWASEMPNIAMKDVIGIAWDSDIKFTNSSGTYVARYKSTWNSSWQNVWKNIEYGITGTAMHFDCIYKPYAQDGYILEVVHVPRGITGNLAQRYAHRYAPGTLSIGWGPASITFDGSGFVESTSRYAFNSPQ